MRFTLSTSPAGFALLTAMSLALPTMAARDARAETPAAKPDAESLANEAYGQHAAGHDADAIATYLRAYEVAKLAVLLYNVAAIYDRTLHERMPAIEYYRRYVGAPDADPALVRKATERITALKAEEDATSQGATAAPVPIPADAPPALANAPPPTALAPALPAPSPPVPPSAPPPTPSDDGSSSVLRPVGIAIGSAGVAGIVASVVLGFLAKGKNDDANALCDGTVCTSQQGVDLAHDAGNLATAGTVTFIAGAALAATGIGMVVLAPRSSAPATARVTLAPSFGSGAGGAVLTGSF